MDAMAASEPKARTADELLRMPRGSQRYELVRGELRQSMPAGHEHGRLAMRIALSLARHVEAAALGEVYAAETGFQLAEDHVRAPDVAFVRSERVTQMGAAPGYWPGAPDLAVEVLSPNDRYTDVEEKVADWLAAGTRMVVVVNPARRSLTVIRSPADVQVLSETATLDGDDVVPGWRLPAAAIFS